jgi:hypothetical protein
MGRIAVVLIAIAIIVFVALALWKGFGAGPGAGGDPFSNGQTAGVESPQNLVTPPANEEPIVLSVDGNNVFVDGAAVGSVADAVAAAQRASGEGRTVNVTIPGGAAASTVTELRTALEAVRVPYNARIAR